MPEVKEFKNRKGHHISVACLLACTDWILTSDNFYENEDLNQTSSDSKMPEQRNPVIIHKHCTESNQLDKLDILTDQSKLKDWSVDLLSAHSDIAVDINRLSKMKIYLPIKNKSKAQNIYISNFEPVC
jgi:hypothetical protein